MNDYGIGNTGVKGSVGCAGTLTKPDLDELTNDFKTQLAIMHESSLTIKEDRKSVV